MAKILIVGASHSDRERLAAVLAGGDHVVVQAPDGPAALERAARERPDVLVAAVSPYVPAVGEWLGMMRADPNLAQVSLLLHCVPHQVESACSLRAHEVAPDHEHTRFQALIEQASDGIVLNDLDGNYRLVNPKFCEMLGYTPEELYRLNIRDTYREEDLGTLTRRRTDINAGRTLLLERMVRRKDGSEFPAEVSVRRIDTGTHLGIVRDISRRRQAQLELQRERELLQRLMDNIPDRIFFKDADSRYIRVNMAQARRMGIEDPAQAVGHTMHAFVDPERARGLEEEDRQVILEGATLIDQVLPHLRPDGTRSWYSNTKAPIRDAQGAIVGLVGIARDVTTRVRAERELAQLLAITRDVSAAGDLASALHAMLCGLCKWQNWQFAQVWIPDPSGERIALSDTWLGETGSHMEYRAIGRSRVLGPGEDLPGRVWSSARAELVADLRSADPRVFPMREHALRAGFESVLCAPILRPQGQVVAVLTFLGAAAKRFGDHDLELLRHLGSHLGEIFERKHAEDLRRASERSFRDMLQNVQLASLIVDAEARITYCNDFLLRLTGWGLEEVLGRDCFEVFLPAECDEAGKAFRGMLAGNSAAWHHECEILTRSGERRLIRWNSSLLHSGAGLVIGAASIGEDVTDQQAADIALAESERRFQQLAETIRDVFFLYSGDGSRLLYVSPAYENIFGRTRDSLYADPDSWRQAVHPEDCERIDALCPSPVPRGRFEWEYRIVRPNREVRWISARGYPILDGAGGVHRIAGIASDVTRIKSGEVKVRRLNRIHEVLGGINSLIAHGIDMTVLFRETCRIAVEKGGFGAAWIGWVDSRAGKVVPVAWQGVEKEVLDSIPLDLAATSGAPTGVIQRVIRERRVFTCDEMKSDWSLPVGESARRLGARSLAILPLVVSGQVNGIFSVNAFESDFFSAAEELTLLTRLATNVALAVERIEQSRIIKELTVARTDAEQASHAKSAFLAAMSHEIRTPMNGVLGLVEVLAHGDLSEQQADLVGTIRESARTLLALIDDVLDFSKIEAGRLELERSPIDAGELVEAVCASLLPMAETANVDLAMFVSPRVSGRLMIDEIRLRQVLYNLVGNAIKFSAGQPQQPGRVSVRLEIACDEPLRIALRVQDNGIGMRPQTVEAIFAPFSQADVSTTRRYGGTGLGLPISKRLVDLMGGEIAVESTFGQGSIFQVELPLERAPGDAPASCVELAELDCVVVGGPKSSADDLAQYLEYGGARVHRADDPARALLQVKGLPQPVVIHDLCGKQSPSKEDYAAYMDAPHVRLLFITRGRRGSARLASPKVLTLDGNALRRAALMRAVLMAAGRSLLQDRPIKAERTPLTVSRGAPSIAEARELGRLILVVEDDAINQKVILQQLGLLGFAAEVAGSGTEALRLWRQGEFALVLTDLHMPEMDGYELVRRIRREERKRRQGSGTAQPGIPILALTANALRGESQAAHQAGMDGYLTKPVPLQELRVALEQWIPGRVRPHCCGAGPDGRAAGPVLEVQVLKNLVGENRTTVRGFLEDYLVAARRLAHDLCAACAQCDPGQVAAIAHKLKSSSRSVGALALGDLCAGLETAGRAMDRTAIARGILEFESAMGSVAAAIEAELTESAP